MVILLKKFSVPTPCKPVLVISPFRNRAYLKVHFTHLFNLDSAFYIYGGSIFACARPHALAHVEATWPIFSAHYHLFGTIFSARVIAYSALCVARSRDARTRYKSSPSKATDSASQANGEPEHAPRARSLRWADTHEFVLPAIQFLKLLFIDPIGSTKTTSVPQPDPH